MIEFLKKLRGRQSLVLNLEKIELENLRKEKVKYLKKYGEEDDKDKSGSESEDGETQDEVDKLIEMRKSKIITKNQRSSVSAEAYGVFNTHGVFTPKVIPKSQEQKSNIISKIGKSILFINLEEKEFETVIDAIEEKRFSADETVIHQGDNGEVLFLVESGELDCYKKAILLVSLTRTKSPS